MASSQSAVVVIKEVSAEICGSCHEPYMTGIVRAEVSVISYADAQADEELAVAAVA